MKKRWKCYVNKKSIKKWGLCIVLAIILGCMCSGGYSGIQYIREGNNHSVKKINEKNFQLDNIEVNQGNTVYRISADQSKIIISFPEKEYISKLKYAYTTLQNTEAKVRIYAENLYGNEEVQEKIDYYNTALAHSIVNIHSKVSRIEIDFGNIGTIMEVSDFEIYNGFQWNIFLTFFLIMVVFFITYMIFFRNENVRYPEIALFMTILMLSGCILVLQPVTCTGMDEQIHFMNAFQLGIKKAQLISNAAIDNVVGNADWLNWHPMSSYEEHLEEIHSMINLGKMPTENIDSGYWSIASVGYIFQTFFLKIGLLLHLPFYICWLMGKMGNLLLYAIGMSIAMYLLPCGKRVFAVIAIAPVSLFICTTYTYDVTVTVFITIGISVLLKMLLTETKFNRKWQVIYILCMVIGCLPKAVYAPLVLLAWIVPKEKYNSKKEYYVFRGLIIASMLLLIASFALPVLFPSGGNEVAGDSRGGNTSISGQMSYVLGQPVAYTVVLVRNIWNSLVDYVIGRSLFGIMGYVGAVTQPILFALLVFGVALTDNYKNKDVRDIKSKHRISILFCIAIVLAFIWTALYLSYTEVGNMVIAGVQARYYLPFIFLIYLCFQNNKIRCNVKVENYQMVVMTTSGCFALWQVFLNFICTRML